MGRFCFRNFLTCSRWSRSEGRDDQFREYQLDVLHLAQTVVVFVMYSAEKILCLHKPEKLFFAVFLLIYDDWLVGLFVCVVIGLVGEIMTLA